ncbi:hypothetical protein M427DRAFT_52899 [Gonapodya prolifera JEL478]|uniref:Uncharacterized protein n=1 Tax=Gonapodya prolifera (strain JEL478) TaxID=1344416 RepID=A0A139ART9_GONPJ|nr:hypothetical protein M427DRAFT_52899 [Gonapodya prolifera JEL478]|eukprot:KXS19458.1 hypothetical protein M427DRAFT_52899 [Gonapodya prolifera JEL478]
MPPPPPYDSHDSVDFKRSFASFRISVHLSSNRGFLSRQKQSKVYTVVDNVGSEYTFELAKDTPALECALSVQKQLLGRNVLVTDHNVQEMLDGEAERARLVHKQMVNSMVASASVKAKFGQTPF